MMPRREGDDAAAGRRVLWALAVVGVVVGAYYAYRQLAVEPAPPPEVVTEPAVAEAPQPVVENPVAPPPPELPPLPPLDESDAAVGELLAGLFGQQAFESLFLPDDLVRRIAASVDNLPREKLALRLRPLQPPDTAFVAEGEEGAYTLGPANHARYQPYLRIVEALDPDALAAAYVRLYPLLQQAYLELGHLDGYFNDRVVAVIDHLLETPRVEGPIALVRPGVMYQFADPALESRSAGQKFLLRMGPDNADRLKAWLRALRERVAQRPPA